MIAVNQGKLRRSMGGITFKVTNHRGASASFGLCPKMSKVSFIRASRNLLCEQSLPARACMPSSARKADTRGRILAALCAWCHSLPLPTFCFTLAVACPTLDCWIGARRVISTWVKLYNLLMSMFFIALEIWHNPDVIDVSITDCSLYQAGRACITICHQ